MSNRAVKLSKPKKISRKGTKTKSHLSLWALILGAATLVGGLLAPLMLLPRPSVAVSEPPDPDNPFSSAFTITNGNIIPLSDVEVGIAPGDVGIGTGRIVSEGQLSDNSGFMTMPKWGHHYLRMDEQFTVTPDDLFGIPPSTINHADLAIIVHYRPWFLPNQRSRAFRFLAHRQTNGHFYWYAAPLE